MRIRSVLLLTVVWVVFPFLLLRCDSAGTSGELDTSFSTDGLVTINFAGSHDEALAGVVLSDGRIAAVGHSYNGTDYDFAIALLTSTGVLDTTFSTDGLLTIDFTADDTAYSAVEMGNGSIAVGGFTASSSTVSYFAIAVVKMDGTLDTSFSTDGKTTTVIGSARDEIRALAVDGDGKLVAAGVSQSGGFYDMAIARYLTTGALDTDFSSDGKHSASHGSGDDQMYGLLVQSTGKYIVGGSTVNGTSTDLALARFTNAGALDTTFGLNGKVTQSLTTGNDGIRTLATDSGDDILAVGNASTQVAMVKFDANGALDLDFGEDATGIMLSSFTSPTVTAAGAGVDSFLSIFVAGVTSDSDFAMCSFSSNGVVQGGFGDSGILATDFSGDQDNAYAVAVQSDGKPIAFGRTQSATTGFDFAIARYSP